MAERRVWLVRGAFEMYSKTSKKEKDRILDEFVELTCCNRRYAARVDPAAYA